MPKVLQTSAMRQIQRVFIQGTATGLSDAQLLERFAADRDEAAFEMLVARHGPMVLGVCRGVLHDPHDAEDAFQASFLVLARKAGSLWVKGSLASWLYQIALRIAVQSRADADRRRRHERQAAESRKLLDGATGRVEPDLMPMLCQEIDRLPEKYRAPVVLCHLEELSHEAAAQVLHCPIGTVHGRLSRARELLRRRLTRRGVTLPLGMAAILGGGESMAAAVPEPLRSATLRAALNLAAGQGVSAAVGSATAGTLLAATLRSMSVRTIETITAIALTIGVAVCASVLAARGPAGMFATADEPQRLVNSKRPRSDAEAIQGTWAVTAIEQVNHQPSEDEKAFWKTGQFTITITADRLIFDVDQSGGSYRLDPSKSPKLMILTMPDSPSRWKIHPAIYSLEGDDLKICLGRGNPYLPPQPPHGFDIKAAPPGTSPTLFVMKRMPVKFDKELSSRIVPGGRDEPMFVDLDTGHFLSPPFALEPVERSRPLAISNLAFPERLKDWVRRQGIDAVVQTDGRTITLLGLELKDSQPMPNPNAWPSLTPAEVLKLFKPLPGQPWTTPVTGEWPRFVRKFSPEDTPVVLPFLTREGGLGLLGLRMDRAKSKDADSIWLTYEVGRGPVRRMPAQALLDDLAGPVHLQTWKGGIVLTRPGCPEWIEIDQGKVVVKVNRPGPAGSADVPETLIEASRLVSDVMDLDGRRLRVTVMGSRKEMIGRRVRDRLEIGGQGFGLITCDRITLDLPNFENLSKDPRVDAIRIPRKR